LLELRADPLSGDIRLVFAFEPGEWPPPEPDGAGDRDRAGGTVLTRWPGSLSWCA
jgi:hypothetical protein